MMAYHLKHWAQVRDFCRIDPTEASWAAFKDNRELAKVCPMYKSDPRMAINNAIDAAKVCSIAGSREGFEACLIWYLGDICGHPRDLSPRSVDEYLKAWDKAGEEVQRLYETHEL